MDLSDSDIEQQIIRMLSGDLSPEEECAFNERCAADARFDAEYRKMKAVWDKTGSLQAAYRIKESTDAQWEQFRQRHFNHRMPVRRFSMLQRVAAVMFPLVMLATLGYFYLGGGESVLWPVRVASDGVDSLYLKDNSLVVLNRNSKVSYSLTDHQRRVKLDGIAYFNVEKDKTRPFIVKLNKSEVRVLGTAFVIENVKGRDRVVVEVTEGRVEFGNDNQKVVMTKGQRGVLENNKISVDQFDVNRAFDWVGECITLHSASLDEVCNELMRYYPEIKNIVRKTSDNDTVRVTTRFDHQSLNEVVEELQIHFGKNFRINDGELVITD